MIAERRTESLGRIAGGGGVGGGGEEAVVEKAWEDVSSDWRDDSR